MNYSELVQKVAELEKRLEIKEMALNEALKEIEHFRNNTSLKNGIPSHVYECLFNYGFDKTNGKPCSVDDERVNANFRNFYNNILMPCGFNFPYLDKRQNVYYTKVKPLKSLSEKEYKDFTNLIIDITKLIYKFKGKQNERNNF